MASAFDEVKDASEKALRRTAQALGDAAIEYGQALSKYAKGNSDTLDVARAGVNLALRGARGALDTGLAFGESYYRFVASLAGIRAAGKRDATAQPKEASAKSK